MIKRLCIIAFLLLVGVAVSADTLNTDVGGQIDFFTANDVRWYSIALADGSGTLDSIYIFLTNTTLAFYSMAIYDNSTEGLIDSTRLDTVDTGNDNQFLGIAVEEGGSITSGTEYRLLLRIASSGTRNSLWDHGTAKYDSTYRRNVDDDTAFHASEDSTIYNKVQFALRIYAIFTPVGGAEPIEGRRRKILQFGKIDRPENNYPLEIPLWTIKDFYTSPF